MRSNGLKLGRIFGIEVSLDLGVVPLVGILTFLLATSVLPRSVPGHVGLTYWTVSLLIALMFVMSLLVHEMAHSLAATRSGIRVKGVTLWLFGGISEMESEPERPGQQFLIAIVGPLASVAFGLVALGASWSLGTLGGPRIYSVAVAWLGAVNIILGVFNVLPGVPLDGGHVVAAAIWKLRRDRLTGRIAAATGGRLLGGLLAAFGFYELSRSGNWLAVWNVGLGVMLYQSAKFQEQSARLERAVGDATVADLMDSSPRSASSLATITQVVESTLESSDQSAVPILDWNGQVIALVDVTDLHSVPKSRWSSVTALAAARDRDSFIVAAPGERVTAVLERMTRLHRRHAAVMVDNTLIGLLGPEQLTRRVSGLSK